MTVCHRLRLPAAAARILNGETGSHFVSHCVVGGGVVCSMRLLACASLPLLAHCRGSRNWRGKRDRSVQVMARWQSTCSSDASDQGIGTGGQNRTGRESLPCLALPKSIAANPLERPERRGRIMKSWLGILLLLARCPPYYCVQHMQAAGWQGLQGKLTSLASLT